MHRVGLFLCGVVALLHLWFFVLESFLWQRPVGLRTFRLSPEKAAVTAQLARNQGVYNAFLSAGLLWALASGVELLPRATFFLACVGVAGVVGALTVSRSIFFVQALPALLALGALWGSR